jgi:hypothetical protein
MQVEKRFHRSLYVTLGLACACLGYAELPYLPEISAFAGVVGLLLIVAYRVEGRWALSIPAANLLGGGIAAFAAFWVLYQFLRPFGTLLDMLPWPTSLLPYLGPLLMILIPAKLFRPKHVGDLWSMHGIGLMAVALGCAMAGDMLFGVLLLAYLVSAMWSLTLFYFYRVEQAAGAVGRGRRPADPPRTLREAGRWTVPLAGVALTLFLLTPRSSDARWEMAVPGSRMQTGYSDDKAGIDLNGSGTLRVNHDVAFEVYAELRDHQPKLDLDLNTRWRGTSFNSYDKGRWENRGDSGGAAPGPIWPDTATADGPTGRRPLREIKNQLPDLGEEQYFLRYHVRSTNSANYFLADPVQVLISGGGDRRQVPVLTLNPTEDAAQRVGRMWYADEKGEAYPGDYGRHGRPDYLQVQAPPAEPGLGPMVRPEPSFVETLRFVDGLPYLKRWTKTLLGRLVQQRRVPDAVLERRDKNSGWLDDQDHEVVARAFEAYLSSSGDFKYSLSLQRVDTKLDPVEDFLINSHKGHCNRYSTALALMLRSVGIPTRVVLGFHGAEPTHTPGKYEVRQSHAHSWVEALVTRPPSFDRGSPWHWLTLDASPPGEAEEETDGRLGRWWEDARRGTSQFFRNYILDYNAQQQEDAGLALWNPSSRPVFTSFLDGVSTFLSPTHNDARYFLLYFVLILGLTFLTVALWRRRHRGAADPVAATTPFYARWLAILHRHGWQPGPAQTPEEFSAAVAQRLRRVPGLAALADLPEQTARLYYRVRYGGRPLESAEQQSVTGKLDRFERTLGDAGPLGPETAPA